MKRVKMIFKELFSTSVGHATRRGVLEFSQHLIPAVPADELVPQERVCKKTLARTPDGV